MISEPLIHNILEAKEKEKAKRTATAAAAGLAGSALGGAVGYASGTLDGAFRSTKKTSKFKQLRQANRRLKKFIPGRTKRLVAVLNLAR